MKITFVRNTPAMPKTGNETYSAGVQADLRHGAWLVAEGYAQEGWGNKAISASSPPVATVVSGDVPVNLEVKPEPINLTSMRIAELRELAAERGIAHAGLRKAELIAALEDSQRAD